MVEVRVLGPVTVYAGGDAVELGPRKRRYLLALLALEINQVLPVERLVDLMWPQSPPRTAVHAVRVSASDLRGALKPHGLTIEAGGGGYVLRADPLIVDAHRFRRLLTQAAAADADPTRLALLEEALGLWRGPALGGVAPPEVRDQLCHGLDEARRLAGQDRIDVLLRLGRHGELLDELTVRAAAYPVQERSVGQLMLALYRSGRVPEALDAFTQAREQLAEQLGLDPGPQLCRLHRRILDRDPELDGRTRPTAPVPTQLPAPVGGFVGRAAELAALDQAASTTPAPVITVGGPAGVGKTTLALQWAHRAAGRFPDGQLYANLRGFDTTGPVASADVVRGFLDALGVPAPDRPETPTAQAALLRSLLAGKRVLMVLDNAASAVQVRPLLPGTPGCTVVVTSRNRLIGLVAVDGAYAVPLALPSVDEARLLLAYRLGERTTAEPAAADALIDACARLPLALAIVAARAATSPELSLAELAGELRRERLDAFDGGDAQADIRAVLSWSYRAVSEPAQRLFRLLGLHPGPSVGVAAAASAAGLPAEATVRLLRELTAAHLLTGADRFTSHDLLRAYAAELAGDDPERDAAVGRILDHYVHSAYTNAGVLDAFRDPVPLVAPAGGVVPETTQDDEAALRWFTTEYAVLIAAVDLADRTAMDGHTWRLACALTEVFERLGHWDDWSDVHAAGLAAARRLGDRSAQARCLVAWGRAAMWLRSWPDAHDRLGQALRMFASLGDLDGRARTHHSLGYLHEQQGGDLALALHHSSRALELFRECGDLAGAARALNAVGWYEGLLGRPDDAVVHCREALDMLQRLGDRRTEALTWDSLAYAHLGRCEHALAVECFDRAIEMMVALGDRFHEAEIAGHLGDAYAAMGDPAAADRAWRHSLERLEALGHPRAEAMRAKLERL